MDFGVPQRVSDVPQWISGFTNGFCGSPRGSGVSSMDFGVPQKVLSFPTGSRGSPMDFGVPQRVSDVSSMDF